VSAFGKRLSRIRELRKWSLTELAEKSGVRYETIYRVEKGTHEEPRVSIAAKLARALGVSLDVLAGVYDDEETDSKIEAAVQAWIEARTYTALSGVIPDDITAGV
jgi:transcriptional regulator with XRE-family HTH domain